MAGALLIEAIEVIEAIEAECERLDSDEGEFPSASPEQGRMGGVGGRNTRLYSAELCLARLAAGMLSAPSSRLEMDGREHLRWSSAGGESGSCGDTREEVK
jgi:hypothetical protein